MSGKAVVRESVDRHFGHASPTPNPFHKTPYVSSLQDKVFVEGRKAIVNGDQTACGDPATSGSSKVLIKGIGVHRRGDSTGGHGSWVPNAAASGSSKVFAGG
jgi:uncharacterized Zn-binding protein involved in type VI secretion